MTLIAEPRAEEWLQKGFSKVEGIRSVAVAAPEVTTFVVSEWTVDPLLKDRKEWLSEKKEEPKKKDPKRKRSRK